MPPTCDQFVHAYDRQQGTERAQSPMLLARLRTKIRTIARGLSGGLAYIRDWRIYNQKLDDHSSPFRARLSDMLPCLTDRYECAGSTRGHYFHQDLWVAKEIYKLNPTEHWDVGSRIDGFVAHLLVSREVSVIDIRKLESNVPGLRFHQGDITGLNFPSGSIRSLSCLHAMEHVGLGRYGDKVDPKGCFQGMKELARVLAPGGRLYFSVPIGRQRTEFNAHRIFDPKTILDCFSSLRLLHFAAIDDRDELIDPANWEDYRTANHACGLFVFTK